MHIKDHGFRFHLIFHSIIGGLVIFAVQLILIQVFRSSYITHLANKQHQAFLELEPVRGSILDRNFRPLAFNIPVYSIFANPRSMSEEDKKKALLSLPNLLGVDSHFIEERLNKNKHFVWLKRKISKEETDKIKQLKIDGISFRKESKRYYPNKELAAHVIGFAGIDNEGLEGIELNYNKALKGRPGWAKILRDAKQRPLIIDDTLVPALDGFHLVLTIDETIQYIAEEALDKAYKKYNARAATIIVMIPRTGEILALANRPTYSLEDFNMSSTESRTNRAVSYVFEPGSVFKIVTVSCALEQGAFNENDSIFCENGQYKVGNHLLHDHHSHGVLTFSEVLEQSSNIGITKIAQRLGPELIYKYAAKFHFGRLTKINLRGEVRGWLKSPKDWSKTTIGAIPIGQEVTVTPIQLICALSSLANDGVLMKPFVVKYIKDNQGEIIKSFEPEIIEQVITPQTAYRVKEILVRAVLNGTGKKAIIKGIRVAGKTGTAQKVLAGQYSHDKFYATFMGFAPADKPELAALVILDEPHPEHFGGSVSAPVFKEVVENSLNYLHSARARTVIP